MIIKEFAYQPKLNGFQNWIETFYEIVSHLETTCDCSGMISNTVRETEGRTGQYVKAEMLTDEFELKYHAPKGEEKGKATVTHYDAYWFEHDYPEAIEAFLKEKETEHFKELHK